ncbi:MAG: cation diffusion facilitator family transporter, partial [Candidatus Micrarchaeia archaeon]
LIGLILVKFGFPIGDPLSAVCVAVIMLYISFELGFKSFKVFMDFSPGQETMEKIENVFIKEKRITRYHKLKARMAGHGIWVDVHIHLPHNTHVTRAHKIAHEIKGNVIKKVPEVKEVNIHIEPD